MTALEILSVCNGLLLALLIFSAREFWSDHKKQHQKMSELIGRLAEIYASKSAMFRAHKRIDALEHGQARHDQRLIRIETKLDMPESGRVANGYSYPGDIPTGEED